MSVRLQPREETPEEHAGRPVLPWQVRLILLAGIWGTSFLFIKVGDEALPPLQVAFVRLLLGTVTLLGLLAMRREPLPRGFTVWAHLAVAAIFFTSVPFTLFAYGETRTTSVLAGIWNGTTPLFTAPIAILMLPRERLTRGRASGLLIGFVGVLVVLGVWRGLGGGQALGNLLCLGAALCYGFGFPYTRKYLSGRAESSVALAAGQVLAGTVQLAIVLPFLTSVPGPPPLKVVGSMLALGMLGTGIAYVLNYGIIRDAGPTSASTVTYLVPIFATILGVVLLGEPLTWNEPVGGAIVILGVAIAQGRLRIARNRP